MQKLQAHDLMGTMTMPVINIIMAISMGMLMIIIAHMVLTRFMVMRAEAMAIEMAIAMVVVMMTRQ